jgi:hypothetical protein
VHHRTAKGLNMGLTTIGPVAVMCRMAQMHSPALTSSQPMGARMLVRVVCACIWALISVFSLPNPQAEGGGGLPHPITTLRTEVLYDITSKI